MTSKYTTNTTNYLASKSLYNNIVPSNGALSNKEGAPENIAVPPNEQTLVQQQEQQNQQQQKQQQFINNEEVEEEPFAGLFDIFDDEQWEPPKVTTKVDTKPVQSIVRKQEEPEVLIGNLFDDVETKEDEEFNMAFLFEEEEKAYDSPKKLPKDIPKQTNEIPKKLAQESEIQSRPRPTELSKQLLSYPFLETDSPTDNTNLNGTAFLCSFSVSSASKESILHVPPEEYQKTKVTQKWKSMINKQ